MISATAIKQVKMSSKHKQVDCADERRQDPSNQS